MDLVPRLEQLGILEVWVRHRELEFLEDIIDEGLADRQREVYVHVRQNFEAILRDTTAEIDLVHFQSSIMDLFNFLKASAGSDVLLQKLDAFDNYLMSHSTNVCYLALLLGMKLERFLIDERHHKSAQQAKDLHLLGLGCLLHDIGKMRVPKEILNKPSRLTPEEMAVMQAHTTLGYEMVKGSVPASAAQVVLNHHQRFDGSGYPARVDHATGEALPPLAGKQIPVFSRIAILADIYDAATTTRCYSAAKPPVQVLHEMRTRLPRVFRSGGRGDLLPHGAAVSHRPGGDALRRRRGGGGRFQRRFPPAAEGAMPAGGRRPTAGPSAVWKRSTWPSTATCRSWPSTAATCGRLSIGRTASRRRNWCRRSGAAGPPDTVRGLFQSLAPTQIRRPRYLALLPARGRRRAAAPRRSLMPLGVI